MKLIAGLGNPGAKYTHTRHNLGFMAVELLASKMDAPFTRIQNEAKFARGRYGGSTVILVKPQGYMNTSGRSIAAIARKNGCAIKDILVLVDDRHLPLGKIRLRAEGSAGGHNGLKSINACLGSDGYPRLRMGMGSELMAQMNELSAYVLSRFRSEEMEQVAKMTEETAQAALYWIKNGVEQTMNRYN
ncbi:MAG: aminoacyl-tRNA hydrolase [Candidatus Hydrogenedentes bacterium]|nr:aminoacyl-tRNA hydrolase [Candidatus Hydrogenedentota bacterium]